MQDLDLDALHKSTDGIHDLMHGRANGQTTAFLYQMLGEAQLGGAGNTYLYIGENQAHASDVQRDFIELIKDIILFRE